MSPSQKNLLKELDQLRRKLQKLSRSVYEHSEPATPRTLDEVVKGIEECTERGKFLRILKPAEEIWDDTPKFMEGYLEAILEPVVQPVDAYKHLEELSVTNTEKVCYLDIETTGLSSTPIFLVGLMYQREDKLVVDQLFARDYSEEEAVLDFLASLLGDFELIVTFNGESFDVPFINERMSYHRIPFRVEMRHIDLLHISRAIVGPMTPNHKLQTLERHLIGRKRIGDIPGYDIPDAYHNFVRTGDASQIETILHHNRLDLITMLQLVTIFLNQPESSD